jgi:hypothetical protein
MMEALKRSLAQTESQKQKKPSRRTGTEHRRKLAS